MPVGSPTIALGYIYDCCMAFVSDSCESTSGSLLSPGQTHHIIASVEDREVLSDEDITQDPQAVTSTAKAGTAAEVLGLWQGLRSQMEGKYSKIRIYEWFREINTYLTDVGGGWEGEFLSMDVEGHIGHLADAVTVDNILRADGEREESKMKGVKENQKFVSTV